VKIVLATVHVKVTLDALVPWLWEGPAPNWQSMGPGSGTWKLRSMGSWAWALRGTAVRTCRNQPPQEPKHLYNDIFWHLEINWWGWFRTTFVCDGSFEPVAGELPRSKRNVGT
jgi:hypothetical protein